jgi:peptidoglycan/xylan/chitin deacetylase (PgdA/CDA1 family)
MLVNKNLIVTTSWDDGTATDLSLLERLLRYGVKGTFYISRRPSQRLLDEKDIKELDENFELGAHTLNHPDLTRVPLVEARSEIEDSKKYLEDLLGHGIAMFCYPYGTYNKRITELVHKAGFNAARTANAGGLGLPENPYAWHITLLASNSSPLMALKICGQFRLWRPGAWLDWESRAKSLFDVALKKGGIYHLYGHSTDHERNADWDRLERVLAYISGRENVKYMTNGEIFSRPTGKHG